MADSEQMYTITCLDMEKGDTCFEMKIPKLVVDLSVTLTAMTGNAPDPSVPIPIPKENLKEKEHMNLVVEYCKFMQTPEFPRETREKSTEKMEGDFTQWEKEFLGKLDKATLFECILLANFLDITHMLNACCKAVADMIKGKTPEEIRNTFNIKNDFTPEEEEQIRRENRFLEEANERV